MTLLVSWIGVDTHGISSAYIVSDSRFSWENGHFDYGKKVFASHLYPEIFGYVGDVLFPSIILSQIVEMIDSNILFDKSMDCNQKSSLVFEVLSKSISNYPINCMSDSMKILYISRENQLDKYPEFYGYLFSWIKISGWKKEVLAIPSKSAILCQLGSGRNEFIDNYVQYQTGNNSDTSRNVFHCFIKTLFKIHDRYCGGAPQLVGIYRRPCTNARNFGIIYEKKRYFLGNEVPILSNAECIEWRNEFFEICDGNTKSRKETAIRQPDLLRNK